MSLVQINKNPTKKQLTIFGLTWLVFFGAVGFWFHHTSGLWPKAGAIWIAAVAVPAVGFISFGFMRLVYLFFSYVTYPIGFVMSIVILSTIYYLMFTPIGLLMRLFGYDPMNRKLEPESASYWIERTPEENVKQYFRQF